MATTSKSKRGRKPLPPGEGKRVPLNMRTTLQVRGKLDAVARASGRSLVQEVEHRLERSFAVDDERVRDFGDESGLRYARSLMLAKLMAEDATGRDALKDPETAQMAFEATVGIADVIYGVRRDEGPLDATSPTEGQEAIITHPGSRTRGQNIRDAILEGLGSLPSFQALIAKLK